LIALQLRARGRGFELPTEVASYLLLRNQRDMTSLFTVLQQLDELSLEKKRRITIPLLKELL
jgi:DnaA family protein